VFEVTRSALLRGVPLGDDAFEIVGDEERFVRGSAIGYINDAPPAVATESGLKQRPFEGTK
jgi:hypothetical protein